MRLLGAPAAYPEPVLVEAKEAAAHGRPFFVWSDGDDLTAVMPDGGESAEQVLRAARRFVPEFAS